jgi:hypothetical protein
MNRIAIYSALVCLLLASPLRAEKPVTTSQGLDAVVSPGDLKATPDMWFYDQAMRRYKDPKMAVRANAEAHAQMRLQRLESMKWFGFSNTRPRASSDPYHNDYSPGWVASPGYYPSRWNGVGQP